MEIPIEGTESTGRVPEDTLRELTKAEIVEFGLTALPYFFDPQQAFRIKFYYCYVGWRN